MSLDAIVLLGCRIGPNDRPSPAAGRRAARAARAWHTGLAPVIIVSGGRRWHGVAEADSLSQALLAAAVPADALIRERCSHTTRENALYVARLLRARRAMHVGVVTCDWHLPRALVAFRRAGIQATGLPALSPPAGAIRRALRRGRERVSWVLDSLASWDSL